MQHDRRHAVQCRSLKLEPAIHELPVPHQGKYEEERKKQKLEKGRQTLSLYCSRPASLPLCLALARPLGIHFQPAAWRRRLPVN